VSNPVSDGWYLVAWSAELSSRDVVPLECLGEPLALYRGDSGKAMLIEPFCPHMGAHLGYGGCLDGDNIVCPFHGWVWDPNGDNVEIPYSPTPNRRRRVVHRTVAEVGGAIWTWHGTSEPAPMDDDIAGRADGWPADGRGSIVCAASVDVLCEALVDTPHLARSLGTGASAPASVEEAGAALLAVHELADATITITLHGPGVATVRSSIDSVTYLQAITPGLDGGVTVRWASSDGSADGWWPTHVERTAPMLGRMRPAVELLPLESEAPVARVRAWLRET
jgi:phenylpropionate dioxygenase-like ring-hydroxylating dioxygenase large terminal subunit